MLNTPEELIAYYKDTFATHGDNAQGMSYTDEGTHYKRIVMMDRLVDSFDPSLARILDVGCGIGWVPLLWKHLQNTVGRGIVYHGVDMVQEYIDVARERKSKEANFVFSCENFLDYVILEPYTITLAIGVIAWQPVETAMAILQKLWNNTAPSGVMAFTYLPDNPLPSASIRWLSSGLYGIDERLVYEGYAKSGEVMVVFKKRPIEWFQLQGLIKEKLQGEAERGEHDDDYADVDLELVR